MRQPIKSFERSVRTRCTPRFLSGSTVGVLLIAGATHDHHHLARLVCVARFTHVRAGARRHRPRVAALGPGSFAAAPGLAGCGGDVAPLDGPGRQGDGPPPARHLARFWGLSRAFVPLALPGQWFAGPGPAGGGVVGCGRCAGPPRPRTAFRPRGLGAADAPVPRGPTARGAGGLARWCGPARGLRHGRGPAPPGRPGHPAGRLGQHDAQPARAAPRGRADRALCDGVLRLGRRHAAARRPGGHARLPRPRAARGACAPERRALFDHLLRSGRSGLGSAGRAAARVHRPRGAVALHLDGRVQPAGRTAAWTDARS